ncbi:hypothetical protein ACGFIW_07860 [Micromonospora sp. NPDC048935]|uniref:hypothetical protein n=1 Tax=Micromonospora sp. NPDC048935 TaxID=3364262 RepID=UPI0037171D32
MAFDITVAEKIADQVLAELHELPFAQLEALLDDNKNTVVIGSDGVRYNVVTYALPDLDDSVRVVVAVDDGGRSAFKPLVRDFIVAP